MARLHDLTGQVFGRLRVVARGENSLYGRGRWECICECGRTVTIVALSLMRGVAKSCGCLRSETTLIRSMTHGMSNAKMHLPEYEIWKGMRKRCYNKNTPAYKNYGGRGISVCDRWNSFELFLHDMGLRPSKGYSLDRIDTNDDYKPENCHWATSKQQCNNKRNNILITINNETLTRKQWALRLNVSYDSLRCRKSKKELV